MRAARAAVVVVLTLLGAGCASTTESTRGEVRVEPVHASTSISTGPRPQWDPRTVDGLALVPGRTLPAVIDPPRSAARLSHDPLSAAVVSVRRGDTVFLLSTAGEWRSVPAARSSYASLSSRGTGLLIQDADSLEVWQVATGVRRALALPPGLVMLESLDVGWRGESSVLIHDASGGGWSIDIETGTTTRVPFPSSAPWTTDQAGVVVETSGVGEAPSLTDWGDGRAREMLAAGTLMNVVADARTVAATTYDGRPFAVVLASRRDLATLAVLPVLDHEGNYSPGAVRPLAIREDGTVVLYVGVFGPGDGGGWRLVVWDPVSGQLTRLSTSAGDRFQPLTVAAGLVAAS